MDARRFDTLARVLGMAGSRRRVLGALLSAVLPGAGSETVATTKHRPSPSHKDHGKTRGKGQGKRRGRGKGHARSEQAPATCFTGKTCTLGKGKTAAKCDFSGQATGLTGLNLAGANLSGASFAGSVLTGSSFKSANLSDVCFVDATLTDVNLTGANTRGAIFCRTIMPDGSTNDSGCAKGTDCCPTCDAAHPCEEPGQVCCEGRCQAIACCGTGVRSTCATGQVCCGKTCVDGTCCGSGARGTCDAGQVCCAHTCATGNCCGTAQCRGGQVCLDHRCAPCTDHDQCGSGQRCCAGQCLAGNCCSAADCTGGEVCLNNTCAPCAGDGQCGSGQRCCAGGCVTGVCCGAADCRPRGNLCVSAGGGPSSCICGSGGGLCPDTQTCCPADAGPTNAGACFDLQTSPANCGSCGNACGPNFACTGGQCVCPAPGFKLCGTACIPANQCCVDGDCPVCKRCVSGACQSVPDRTVGCDRRPLEQVDPYICTSLFSDQTGICVGGVCNCGNGTYDATTNTCRCDPGHVAECAAGDCKVCEVASVCFVATGGPIVVLGTFCLECHTV